MITAPTFRVYAFPRDGRAAGAYLAEQYPDVSSAIRQAMVEAQRFGESTSYRVEAWYPGGKRITIMWNSLSHPDKTWSNQ